VSCVGAKLSSKGLVQRFGVECCVKCKGLVLGVGCYARIRCGFPVKKGISVRIRIQVGRAGCGHFRVRCGCGAEQTS
jgi:hypothetical protein